MGQLIPKYSNNKDYSLLFLVNLTISWSWWNADRLFVARCQLCCYLQFTTDKKNIYRKYSSIWYLYTKAEILIDWLIEASRRPVQNSCLRAMIHRQKKLSHFAIKSWVTCGIKIRPGKVGNWRLFESSSLDIKNLIDPTLRV